MASVKQRVRAVLLRLVPRPRRPVALRQIWPLLAFWALFAAVCVGLEATHTLLFVHRLRLLWIVLAAWLWWLSVCGYSGLPRRRAAAALAVRWLLLALLVMALAEPRGIRTSDTLAVIYAVDLSDSVGDETVDRAMEFVVRTVHEKPAADKAGLVVFARNAAVELPPKPSFAAEELGQLNAQIDRDATNIEQALSLAAAMLPAEDVGRIVLVSDGTETAGNLWSVLDELRSRGIAVDVWPIQYDYDYEVWLERLELPNVVKLGENYEASVVLSALHAGTGKLILRENGRIVFEQDVSYRAGKNRFVIPIRVGQPGYYEYAATLQVDRKADRLRQNNTVVNYLLVGGRGRILIVKSPEADGRDYRELVEALRKAERVVEVIDAYEFPRDPLKLMPYDSVAFVNAPADEVDPLQMKAVRDAVYNLGIGFLMIGGRNSFGPGGYHRSPIEEVLPVSMDISQKKILPKAALVIILHTCEFPQGNTWAKRITKRAIKVLSARDLVGVLDFEGREKWVFELTPAGDYTRLARLINAAEPGDMPTFSGTMRMGLKALRGSDAAARHMIIISDGDPAPPPPELLAEFQKEEISVSTVAVFPHGGTTITTLRSIAQLTGGRFYFPDDPSQLPAIFVKEAKTLRRTMIQNRTFVPQLGFPDPVVKGITALPPLHGYVITTAKSRAQVVLQTPPQPDPTGLGEPEVDPVLAKWRFGLGTTVAFTSDLGRNWGADWVQWERYEAFVTQLFTDIARVQKQQFLRVRTYADANEGVIVVEDFHPEQMFLEVQAEVRGPHEQATTLRLEQMAPGRYAGRLKLWGQGRYQVRVVGVGGGRREQVVGGLIVSYSPEYLRFRSNPIVLQEIAKRTGGVVLDDATAADDIYRSRRQTKRTSRPIFDWFLAAVALLIPLDVAVRRVQIDWAVIRSLLPGGRAAESTATMSTLLQRKAQLSEQLGGKPESPSAAPPAFLESAGGVRQQRSTSADTSQTASKAPEAAPQSEQGDEESTTARLLAIKRRRQQS
ncbi:MAG: VWA domain-containing protein [Planctomycetota bacterium]|nr:MAG: VWA domain-containing protein [Planctomycetota bacterium]